MPALPTTNLTLHQDASDNDHLWKTYVSGGPNTGVPADGDTIEAWDDEFVSGQIMKQIGAAGLPVWRSTTPLMALPCLDFAGGQRMGLTNASGTARVLSDILGAAAATVFIAFYAESITGNSATVYHNDPLCCDAGAYFGIFLKDVGAGSYVIQAFNYNGGTISVEIPVTVGASHVVMMRNDGANLYIALDGGGESSVASNTTANINNQDQLAWGDGSNGTFDGRIGERAVYNAALSGADLANATAYFTDKWLGTGAAGLSQFTAGGLTGERLTGGGFVS